MGPFPYLDCPWYSSYLIVYIRKQSKADVDLSVDEVCLRWGRKSESGSEREKEKEKEKGCL